MNEISVASPVEQVNVLGVGVHAVDMESTTAIVRAHIQESAKGYVCLAGVHGIMEAQRQLSLRTIFADAVLVAPDGMPTVWMGRLNGFSRMQRVFGPDLMANIIGSEEFGNCVHFFCGGAPGVAENLRDQMLRRFPHARITGTYSPPFRPMTSIEERELAAKVRLAKPDIIWVGLSTPKQERFMARYLPMLDTTLMIGVGAAFLFHTGAIQDSPAWMKQVGLQWLHRLIQEPARLWKRYLLNNPLFLVHAFLQIMGWKRYTLETGERPLGHMSVTRVGS
jgi:N-acetylglucosaminyldiphosphoundecaprenol N-acetyl-beta-D-mannosaminyltransferase